MLWLHIRTGWLKSSFESPISNIIYHSAPVQPNGKSQVMVNKSCYSDVAEKELVGAVHIHQQTYLRFHGRSFVVTSVVISLRPTDRPYWFCKPYTNIHDPDIRILQSVLSVWTSPVLQLAVFSNYHRIEYFHRCDHPSQGKMYLQFVWVIILLVVSISLDTSVSCQALVIVQYWPCM